MYTYIHVIIYMYIRIYRNIYTYNKTLLILRLYFNIFSTRLESSLVKIFSVY